jgi:hypothetical protein
MGARPTSTYGAAHETVRRVCSGSPLAEFMHGP